MSAGIIRVVREIRGKKSDRNSGDKRGPGNVEKRWRKSQVSPIIAGMAAKKPKSELTRAQVLIEEIRRLQLRALELMEEAQEIIEEGSVGKSPSRKSKK